MKRITNKTIRPLRVLLVEDSPEDCEIVVRELARHDFAVVHERVETRQEMERALDRAPWDLVVADSSLPCFSGLAAIELLCERGESVPVIMVSGTRDEQVVSDAIRAGARDFIDKRQLARLGLAVHRELRFSGTVDNAPSGLRSGVAAPSSWTDAKEWLTTQSWPSLDDAGGILQDEGFLGADWIEELSFREIHLRPQVNRIVERLCRNSELPPLEPIMRCLVALRLEYARGIAIGFSSAETRAGSGRAPFLPQISGTLEARLRWMMIDSWELNGCFLWEALSYWLTDWRGDEFSENDMDSRFSPSPKTSVRSRRRGKRGT